ncbi:uncharacterized protein TNIN_338441 [Trichonephila inaurata madagascariensis]|uniref:Uncharacterized protein n=1 Tax=Trichonephila inaurata madagascariensis TaxID=2747483 RepID=A0A8X7BU34_9ARAC|nr:uncharacterized protein TNIN_338441 [Trichonephila inaurata madagascariensis]
MEDISLEDSIDAGLEESICIDDVIFYGPVTAKEKLIREKFEKRQKEKLQLIPSFKEKMTKEHTEYKMNTCEENKNEIIKDLSLYESFSIDETKYESFEDSLDEGNIINPKEVNVSQLHPEQMNVNFRRPRNKQSFRGLLCDSLEDIHSLVSNVEKLSISEDIENINILENNHLYDDSLKNDICFENKNTNSVEQNFDDDSLAILEYEKTFDDSLEEADLLPLLRNGMSDAEISVENLSKENVCVTKNLFETSVEVIYENVRNVDISESNCEIFKQSTGDSLSISENMSKDSLNEQQIHQQSHEKMKNIVPPTVISEIHDRKTKKSEGVDPIKNIETGLNLKTATNLMDGLVDSNGEESASALNSKDEILIEDSCSLSSSNTEYNSAKSKLSANENIKENMLLQVNETILIDDSINYAADSVINNSSFTEENQCNISEKKISETGSNDTIWIDDSFVVCNQSCMNEEINHINERSEADIHFKTEIASPIKDTESENPAKYETSSHLNDTICIDDSYIIPVKPVFKESPVKKISKFQSNDDKNCKGDNLKTDMNQFNKNCATFVQNSESVSPFSNKVEKVTIASALNIPLSEYIKCNVKDSPQFKNPEKETKPSEDAFVPTKDLLNEANLKLQVEVAFDKNQGLNIISISTVEQCPQNELNLASELNAKKVVVGINQNSNFNNCRENINTSVTCKNNQTGRNLEKGEKPLHVFKSNSNIANNSKHMQMLPDKNNANVHIESGKCDAQLLQALDLHDTSCSVSDDKYLQSRDSIMPLNLCIRNKSREDFQLLKSESKENIPVNCSSKNLKKEVTTSDSSKRNSDISQTTDKTPKHFNTVVDVKKSGNKANSVTKIPVRKVDSTFTTPVHQKIGKSNNLVSSAEKPPKSPLVKSASATDSLSSVKVQNTPRKLHFCTVRNSISRVPKSAQRPAPKKFQCIESPIAKYIGKAQIHAPLVRTHRYDGNVVSGSGSKSSKSTVHSTTVKTPNSAVKGSPKISSLTKV